MKIEIVCTCGGGVRPWRLGFILEVSHRSPVGVGCEMVRDADGQGRGYRLRCGRCPRNKLISFHNWARLVAGLDQADATRLDLSALPF